VRPSFSASQSVPVWFMALATVSGHLWTMAFVAAGTITLIFAILERVQAKSHWLENWSPRKLPRVRNVDKNTRTNAAFELAILVLAISWWCAYMDTTVVYLGESVRFDLKPQWLWFFWCYLLILLFTAAIAALNLFRPASSRSRAAMRLANSVLGGMLLCLFLNGNLVAGITAPNLTAQKSIEYTNAMNHWMITVLPIGVIAAVVIAAIDVYRILRIKPPGSRSA